jgi:putative peptide zinc metalloprotease protein
LGVVPFPHYFRAGGVVQAREWSQVITDAPGEVTEILAVSGKPVTAGQPLLRLENPELALQIQEAKAVREEIEARLRAAIQGDSASVDPLTRRLESADKLMQRLAKEQGSLIVRSRNAGMWIAPGVEDLQSRWLKRGSPLGLVVNPRQFEFSVTVLQEDVNRIFQHNFRDAQVRLPGQADRTVVIKELRVVPGEQRLLPSPALGWEGGGEIAVSRKDDSGRTAAEPFFSVIGQLQNAEDVSYLHGQTGKARFKLANEPLLTRWVRDVSQALQKRFQF